MNWLVLTLLSLVAWALVDVLSKYVSTENDPDAHLELIIIVGLFLLPTLFSSLGESESGLSILQIVWKYKTWILTFLAGEYTKKNWVMQLHYGVIRNINTKSFRQLED